MAVATMGARVLLVGVVGAYFSYLIFFIFSSESILYRFSRVSEEWVATIRTILLVALSPGAIPAAFSVAVMLYGKNHVFALTILSVIWFAVNLVMSFVIAPFFWVWAIMQVVWAGLFAVLWSKVIA